MDWFTITDRILIITHIISKKAQPHWSHSFHRSITNLRIHTQLKLLLFDQHRTETDGLIDWSSFTGFVRWDSDSLTEYSFTFNQSKITTDLFSSTSRLILNLLPKIKQRSMNMCSTSTIYSSIHTQTQTLFFVVIVDSSLTLSLSRSFHTKLEEAFFVLTHINPTSTPYVSIVTVRLRLQVVFCKSNKPNILDGWLTFFITHCHYVENMDHSFHLYRDIEMRDTSQWIFSTEWAMHEDT
jgi:hypothetical protein